MSSATSSERRAASAMPKAISARSRSAAKLSPVIDHRSCMTMSASAASFLSGASVRERRMPASTSATTAPFSARCGATRPARLCAWAMAASARPTEGGPRPRRLSADR